MPTTSGKVLDTVYHYNGSAYSDITLEMQSPAGTSKTILEDSNDFLYLGDDEKFNMVLFDLDQAGTIANPKWEYSNGSNWTEFFPGYAEQRYNDSGELAGQNPYAFATDGGELILEHTAKNWATLTFDGLPDVYWIRVSTSSTTTAPTIKSINIRPINTYCTTADVYDMLQLKNVLDGTDFTASTVPSKAVVERYIQAAESTIDYRTRKAWRTNYVIDEFQEFNLNGFKLDKADPYKVIDLAIWTGNSWETKSPGRGNDYFLVPDTGMIHFARFFILPARFQTYTAPLWRWGAGEFIMPVKISYLAGRSIQGDNREGAFVHEITKKMAGADVLRNSDFGFTTVSGSDRVPMGQKLQMWEVEVNNALDELRGFETF
jgi:hypothetical protein